MWNAMISPGGIPTLRQANTACVRVTRDNNTSVIGRELVCCVAFGLNRTEYQEYPTSGQSGVSNARQSGWPLPHGRLCERQGVCFCDPMQYRCSLRFITYQSYVNNSGSTYGWYVGTVTSGIGSPTYTCSYRGAEGGSAAIPGSRRKIWAAGSSRSLVHTSSHAKASKVLGE